MRRSASDLEALALDRPAGRERDAPRPGSLHVTVTTGSSTELLRVALERAVLAPCERVGPSPWDSRKTTVPLTIAMRWRLATHHPWLTPFATMNVSVDAEALTVEAVTMMTPKDWNETAFGVIELDTRMIVRTYNRAESSMSRRDPAKTVGRHFFDDIAPCTDGPGFRGRLEGLRHGDEDRFDFDFAFPWGRKRVRVRALRLRESLWLMVTPIQSGRAPSEDAYTATPA